MARTKRLQTEQDHHRKAFEHYAHQVGRRSYQKTAAAMGVSPSAVKLWANSFDWRGRLHETEAQAARQVAEKALQTPVAETLRQRKIVQMALVRLAKAIADGRVKMQMGDLDRLIRLLSPLDETRPKAPGEYTAAEIIEIIRAIDQATWDEFERLTDPIIGADDPPMTGPMGEEEHGTALSPGCEGREDHSDSPGPDSEEAEQEPQPPG